MEDAIFGNENIDLAYTLVTNVMESSQVYDEESIDIIIERIKNAVFLSDEKTKTLKKRIHSSYGISLEPGIIIKTADHKSWFHSRKANVNMKLWNRYREYLLQNKFPKPVVSKQDVISDEIMDLIGDPALKTFRKRGLVVGDVQSGKTNYYTMLSCKASDVGYKVIILLTGTIESLRKQTQARMDLGFVGCDSLTGHEQNKRPEKIGVGIIDPEPQVIAFTSVQNDFNSRSANIVNLSLKGVNAPVLLVVKKNKGVLQNLLQWMERKNTIDGIIDLPLLLIDDEADNASVNTNETEPTAINRKIREILNLFTKSTYMGFTATPYANIFIDPDIKEDEMLEDDLFPRDFIYSLSSSSNYIGPVQLFSDEGVHNRMLRLINDAAPYIPQKQKSTTVISELPPSLIKAINCFVLANRIRDLDGYQKGHKSMLVNVSHFIALQEQVKDLITEYVFDLKRNLQAYSALPFDIALNNKFIKSIYEDFLEEYSDCNHDWQTIIKELNSSCQPIEVRCINSRNSVKNLDYSSYVGGLRIIAVGGNALSRGLTLEGLLISYFYRKSQTYDTLMQMGRWFGYRDGYDHLCRVWMTEDAKNWYSYISDATEELKNEIEDMRNDGKTPRDFGLRVRSDPIGLFVTARNKMRTAREIVVTKSLSGRVVETPYLYYNKRNAENFKSLIELIKDLKKAGINQEVSDWSNPIWYKVPYNLITDFFENFRVNSKNTLFDVESLSEFIKIHKEDFAEWDIVIPRGYGQEYDITEGVSIKKVQRGFAFDDDDSIVQMTNRRLLSPEHTREGLRKNVADILSKQSNKTTSAKTYLKAPGRRPLLIVYLVQLKPADDAEKIKFEKEINTETGIPLVGLVAGFPDYGIDKSILIKYKVNKVYQQMNLEDFEDEDLYVD